MDKLLNLVRSLSITEKSQFIKYTKQHLSKRESQKILLFKLVNKQVRKQIRDYHELAKKRIPTSTLPSLKTQLYNQILTSLTYNSVKSSRHEVSQMIDEIQTLIDRGLLKQALARIEKAKSLAIKGHLHFLFLEISLLHRRIIRQHKTKDVTKLLQQEQVACNRRTAWIAEEFDLLTTYESFFIKNRKEQLLADDFEDTEVLQWSGKKIDSFEGQIYHHLIRRMHYNSLKDFRSGLEESKKLLRLFEQNRPTLMEKLPRYLRNVTNYINVCLQIGDYEEAKRKIEAVKAIHPKTFYSKAQVERSLLNVEIVLLFKQRQFAAIAQLIPRIEDALYKYQHFIPYELTMSICYNLGVSLSLLDQYGDALDWLNRCLQAQDHSELKEKVAGREFGILIRGRVMVYRLIVFYEMKEIKLIKNLLSSVFYFFENHNLAGSLLHTILLSLADLIKGENENGYELLKLKELLKEDTQHEEFSLWVNSALEQNS